MEQYIIDLFSVYFDNQYPKLWNDTFNKFKKYLKEKEIVINSVDDADKAINNFFKENKIKPRQPKPDEYHIHEYKILNDYVRKMVKFRL